MPIPRKERTIEVPISEQTLKDYIAMHLDAMTVIRHDEGVIKMDIGDLREDGTRMIKVMFIQERDIKVIRHK